MRVRLAVLPVLAVAALAGCRTPPAPPAEQAPRPVVDTIEPAADLGAISFPTSGAPDAQADFLRGVAWLHNFGYDDAIEAFRAAQAKDPRFAMAYWGEALAYSQPLWFGEEPEKGRAVLARLAPTPAARLALAPTEREQGFLRAAEALWGPGDTAARARAYADAMAALAARHPDDDEVQVFYALALLATMPRGDASLPIREQAGRIVEDVFRRNPRHPGAAHLILHAYDHGALAPRGLAAARAYAKIAPASSHALHMPAHFFVQLGYWLDAASSDEASWRASVAWSARRGQPVTTHDFHSLVWWQYELTQLGQFDRAQQVASEVDRALAIVRANDVIGGHHYGDSEIGRGAGPAALRNDKGSMRARLVLESERWSEMAGQSSFDNVDELFALGVSALRLNDPPRARAAYQELVKAAGPDMDPGLREQAAIMVLEIEALAAAIDETPAVAFSKMDDATALQARMPKPIGRPYPVKGADELYGELLLQFDRSADAAAWFEKTLARTPNRSRAVLGLARAAGRAGQAAKSRKAYEQFLANWANADPGLPELAEARAALGR
ncbi:MAG: tetratricopeptide repeat protein [Vicinamibacterales bacterium]